METRLTYMNDFQVNLYIEKCSEPWLRSEWGIIQNYRVTLQWTYSEGDQSHGFHMDWKKRENIFQSGKSPAILNRLEKVREYWVLVFLLWLFNWSVFVNRSLNLISSFKTIVEKSGNLSVRKCGNHESAKMWTFTPELNVLNITSFFF